VAGNMYESVPSGDAVLLQVCFINYNHNKELMRNCINKYIVCHCVIFIERYKLITIYIYASVVDPPYADR
jgi:hypothetical protein